MATITALNISTDGWSAYATIAGWAGEQGNITYDFSDFSLLVTSEGYNAAGVLGTVQRTVTGTKTVRQPHPNELLLDEVDSGSDIVVRIALSDRVYDDDKNGGVGTSGSDPVATIGAGWATITAGSTDAVAGLTVTNNSTLDYPKVIGQWDWANTPLFSRVESDFKIGFRARHGFNIAAVVMSATGSVSSHVQASTQTSITRQGPEQNGLYHEAYSMPVPIAGFSQGEEIALNAIAYPIVGDADSVLDTSVNTDVNDTVRGLTQITCHCDKTGALKQYAVVDVAGVDASGVVSATLATAEASPYLTVGGALGDGATVIYCNDGTHDILGLNPSATVLGYAVEVAKHPAAASVTLNRSGSFRVYNTKRLIYRDLSVSYSGGNGWLDGGNGDNMVFFKDCSFSNTATPVVGLGYKSKGCWFVGCTGLGVDDYVEFSSSRIAYSFTSCTIIGDFKSAAWLTVVACDGVADRMKFGSASTGNPLGNSDNSMFEHNRLMGMVAAGTNNTCLFLGASGYRVFNTSVIGNVTEHKSITTSGPAFWIAGDGSTGELDNVILAHNTVAGSRCNLFYNDAGSTAVHRTSVWVVGNSFQSYNIKSDTFPHPVDGRDGGRVGNWPQVNGVGYRDNRYDGTASSDFVNDYDGCNTDFVTARDQVFGDMGYTDEQSSDGGGAGNGDYIPGVGSVLLNHALSDPYISYDLNGNPRGDQIGALFLSVAPTCIIINNVIVV
ncbi:MAG: hypothetical protein ACPGF7_09510 [Pontibacterium sp.]